MRPQCATFLPVMQMAVYSATPSCSLLMKYLRDTNTFLKPWTLQDLHGNDLAFGGITIRFAGDWRQILSAERHGSRLQILDAILKSSHPWKRVPVLRLTKNLRVALTGELTSFSNYLLSIGDGAQDVDESKGEFVMRIPQDIIVNTEQELLDFVFGDI